MISATGPIPDIPTTLALFAPGPLHAPPMRPHPGGSRPARTKALELILARSDRLAEALPDSTAAAMFTLFGVAVAEDHDLPVAAVTRVVDIRATNPDWWIRADPVSLEPHGDGLVLHAGEALELSAAEAEALAAPLKEDCEAAGWRLEAPHPLRWYLQPPRPPADLLTTPLDAVVGRDIGARLPAGRDGGNWRRRLSEFQLLLHANPVNEARQNRGAKPINSLWFWGGGVAPRLHAGGWSTVWTNAVLGKGLAQLGETKIHPLPADLHQWLSRAGTGRHLVILDVPAPGTAGRDGDNPLGRIEGLERTWFGPSVAALRNRRLGSFTLFLEGQPALRATRSGLRRWWRRRQVLGG